MLINGILLFLCYFFGGAVLTSYFHEPRLDLLANALAFTFVLVSFRLIPNALLNRQLDFKLRAQLEIAATIIATGVTLLLAFLLMTLKPWFIMPKLDFAVTRGLISAEKGMGTVQPRRSLHIAPTFSFPTCCLSRWFWAPSCYSRQSQNSRQLAAKGMEEQSNSTEISGLYRNGFYRLETQVVR